MSTTKLQVPTVPTAKRAQTAKNSKNANNATIAVIDDDDQSGSSDALVSATPPRRPSHSCSSSDDSLEESNLGPCAESADHKMQNMRGSAGAKKRSGGGAEKPPVHKSRKPSAEERALDADALVSSWLSDLAGIAGAMQSLQAEVTARGACNESPGSLGDAHMAFVQLCSNAHIVAHNFLNAVIPSLPEQQVHEIGSLHEHSAIIGTFQQLTESVERHMDAYASFTRRLAEIGDLDRGIALPAAQAQDDLSRSHGGDKKGQKNSSSSISSSGSGSSASHQKMQGVPRNPYVPAAVDACCFTAHYTLLRSLRAVVCQINILNSALERRSERLRSLLAGKREKGRHAQLYF